MRALIIIDMEQGFLKKSDERNNPKCEENILLLREYFEKNNDEVIHIQHRGIDENSAFFNEEGYTFMRGFEPKPHEKVFIKNVNSAFIGTQLKQYLDQKQFEEILIVGLTLPHCVSTTTRMAGNYGYNVILIEDATATFKLSDDKINLNAQTIHDAHILALKDEFCQVLTTEEYLNR